MKQHVNFWPVFFGSRKTGDDSVERLDQCLEGFYAICDQIDLNLVWLSRSVRWYNVYVSVTGSPTDTENKYIYIIFQLAWTSMNRPGML